MANLNAYVQVPADGAGKKVRSVVQTMALGDLHSEFVIALTHARQVTNVYNFCSLALVIGASADGANVGRIYVENDPDSTVFIAITRIRFRSQLGSALLTPTSPVISLRRFTFTGNTPSGTAISGSLMDSTMTAKDSNWNVRTAATGMTITEGADIVTFLPTANDTAVGQASPSVDEWAPDRDAPLILRAGQGALVKQVDAGTTSDTRRFIVDIVIEEMIMPT